MWLLRACSHMHLQHQGRHSSVPAWSTICRGCGQAALPDTIKALLYRLGLDSAAGSSREGPMALDVDGGVYG